MLHFFLHSEESEAASELMDTDEDMGLTTGSQAVGVRLGRDALGVQGGKNIRSFADA